MNLSNKAIREINGSRPITEADWTKVKEFCSAPFGQAEFFIDGFEVTLVRGYSKKRSKVETSIYINGLIKGEWFTGFDFDTGTAEHEEVTRFFPLQTKMRHSKAKKELDKAKPKDKKFLKEFFEEHYGKDFLEQKCYLPSHNPSFAAIKKHWLANNKSIEVVQINGELA